ncbi:hypothetical protein [Bradyrhizobium sp. CCBAU 11357]|uniref:hypothetical protein n=1 Tax=Bradyrhizobium sp. CCBAU 11357 TaxID=1630808 RepID=UPI002303489B|nr:hypothetical protein [Bradyrhizobium sp. CCBAU 11357]MDA9498156.1 hypothetical protein [Bradyrhizobium sp. CCBAU 11357]
MAEATEVLPRDPEGRLAIRAEFAQRQVETVAARWKVTLTNHDAAMSRVRAAVHHVQETINTQTQPVASLDSTPPIVPGGSRQDTLDAS